VLAEFVVSLCSTIAAVLLLAAVREIRTLSRTVGDSAAAVSGLTRQVAKLAEHDESNRQAIAALWARSYPPSQQPPWSTNANSVF
jgi:hypothetical protein